MDLIISIAGSFIRTYPTEITIPKKPKTITMKDLLGALLSKGMVTGLIVVNTGVSLLT